MIRQIATAALIAGLAGAAGLAQQAERVGGPLHEVGLSANGEVYGMLAGALPVAPPQAPVDVWLWYFYSAPRSLSPHHFDVSAQLTRVDCQAGTLQIRRLDLLLGDVQVASETSAGRLQTPEPGSLPHLALSDVCDPSGRADPDPFEDHRQARAAVRRFFDAQ